jgi:hypothetical protein
VATSEAEINWRRFLESVLARGLQDVKLIVALSPRSESINCCARFVATAKRKPFNTRAGGATGATGLGT